jgi:hypothetical protein
MNKLSDDQERNAVDLITDCMYAIDYLIDISNYTFSDKKDTITLGQFYQAWFRKTRSTRKAIIPFNPGIFLGYLYVGILYAKENWFNLLPEDVLSKADPAWGLRDATVSAPKEADPTVKYIVRRIRNSLGHGRPTITIPAGIKPEELFTKITISFHDVSMSDGADTFDIALTLEQLFKLIKKFQSVIHKFVREKR